MSTDPFKDAVLRRLGFEGDYEVNVVTSGGGEYPTCQNDTCWESVPYRFDLRVMAIRWEEVDVRNPYLDEPPHMITVPRVDESRPSGHHEFASIPALWAWLDGDDEAAVWTHLQIHFRESDGREVLR